MNEIVQSGGPDTAINQWDPNSGAPLPAYLANALDDMGTNIPERMNVPSLSYEGKTWQIVKDGTKTKLQVANGEGDMIPVPIMRVVILNCNPDRGRAYYEGAYNPATAAAPLCWSADGKAPDASVKEKVSPLCASCPMSVKGSKVQDGREMVACSSHRMLAVLPAGFLNEDPLRLKIAVTSDYDKEIVEHGWFAFRQYMDFLKTRGLSHTALVVTKIKFDMNAQFPKLLFALDRILTAEEVQLAKLALANPKTAELLAERWTAAGSNGTPIDDSDIAPQPDLQTTIPVGHIEQPSTIPGKPAPADPNHIAHAGTEHEVWWDGAAWIKPWPTAAAAPTPAPAPPPPPALSTEPAAAEPKPADPNHIAHAGTEHEVWWDGAAWVKPWASAPAPAPEPAPPPPPAEPAAPPVVPKPADPNHIAHAGTAHEVWWNGAEWVAPWEAGNAAAAPAAPATADPAAATVVTTSASPSDEVPADVAALLGKWA